LRAVTLQRPAISEWRAFATSDLQFAPFVALVALILLAWIGSRRPRPLAHTLVLLVAGWQACLHSRHAPFLGVLAALWLPLHVQSLVERWGSSLAAAPSSRAPA